MRTVLKDRSEVAHYWANQIQSEGRASNIFFRDSLIYSYGHHFCIARILPNGVVSFTTRSYSVTTRAHKSAAHHAASHREFVYCDRPDYDARSNMSAARSAMRSALADSCKPRIRNTTRVKHRARALAIGQQANAYLAALPVEESTGNPPIDLSNLDGVAQEVERIEAAQRTLREEQHKARFADLQNDLVEWRAHAIIARSGFYELPIALRLSTDRTTIQTSHGAEIPASHAPRLWSAIQRARATQTEWHANGHTIAAGVYELSTICADGSIVVGCHNIAFAEIEAMAQELGISQVTA